MSKHVDDIYMELVKEIMNKGVEKGDRTGTGTTSYFGPQMRFDLQEGFPLLTTKKLPFRIIAEESLWFKNADTNLKTLLEKDVHIWDADAYRDYLEKGGELRMEDFLSEVLNSENGYDLGPIYGKQWREWDAGDGRIIDQLGEVIEELKVNPDSRRLVVSAWNPSKVENMVLPPCHVMFQFYVAQGKLSCKMYQRSADAFLGLPFNIASYALLTHIVARMTDFEVGDLIISVGDAHLYSNHVQQIYTQVIRYPKPMPELIVKNKYETIDEYTMEDFELIGYDPHPTIKGKVSVGLEKIEKKEDQ